MPWGTLVTGAVGLAGIAGTAWQSKRSREAQSKDLQASIDAAAQNLRLSITTQEARAIKTEKRRIYARFLATCAEVVKTQATLPADATVPAEASQAAGFRADITAMSTAFSETQLIAPAEVALAAGQTIAALRRHRASSASEPGNYFEVHRRLIRAMRVDLGEPISQQADVAQSADPPSDWD